MNLKNIVKLNFSDRLGRMDYFRGILSSILISLSGVAVIAFGAPLSESMPALGVVAVIVGILPIVYAIVLQFALVTRRFRDIGFNDTGALFAVVVAYVIVNAMVPFVGLALLFWKGKEVEATAA